MGIFQPCRFWGIEGCRGIEGFVKEPESTRRRFVIYPDTVVQKISDMFIEPGSIYRIFKI